MAHSNQGQQTMQAFSTSSITDGDTEQDTATTAIQQLSRSARPSQSSPTVVSRIGGGQIRLNGGRMEWLDPFNGVWYPAVYHDQIRDQLIDQTKTEGTYRYGRASGELANDITSFHKDQEDWGEDRSQWPAILYQYEPRQGDVSHKKPPIWTTQDGYVILDIENDPVMAFEEIPDTISSVIEAPFLEAFCRLNQHIKIKDIRARMLRDPTEQGEWNGDGKDPIRIGNLSMKMTRFRERSGMITWGRRAGSTNIKAYLDSILPQVCKDENSIRRFRDLHKHERAAMHLSNIGKFPERGRGKKDLSDRPLSTVSESLTGNDEESIGAGVDDTDGAEDELAEPMENEQPMNDGIAYDNEVDTENIDNTNFLSAAPTSLRHQELVHHLLEPTREEYRCCTSQDPPETNPELSYLSQYWVIQAAFETYWEEHRPVGLETATPPQLVGVMDIVPSKISWNASPAPIIAVDLSSLIQELLG